MATLTDLLLSPTILCMLLCYEISPINSQATVTAYCDNYGEILHSNGGAFTLDAQRNTDPGAWHTAIIATISCISSSKIIRVRCFDVEHTGGFIAQVTYLGQDYYSTNPLTSGYWRVISAEIGSTSSLQYYQIGSDPWGRCCYLMNSNAYWVWNGQHEDTMTFDLDMGLLPMFTAEPTTTTTTTGWISSTMTRSEDQMAVGVYNCKIFLIGGYNGGNTQQAMTYDISSKQFNNIGLYALSDSLEGGKGQFYTQQGYYIYIVDRAGSTFDIYNMATQTFTKTWNGISISTNVDSTGCLASTSSYLFLTGGGGPSSPMRNLQILSLSTNQWVDNAPLMQEARRRTACIVADEYLWIFGGDTATNERIQVESIISHAWNYVDPLTETLSKHRCAYWSNNIYIVGGGTTKVDATTKVHVMDTITGVITLLQDALPEMNEWSASIAIDSVLYVFGGFYSDSTLTNQYAYNPLISLTNSPTTKPSKHPTKKPSGNPIKKPSKNPTKKPSGNPTKKPSKDPTKKPSENPTKKPSRNPTKKPSKNPTKKPSENPTNAPSEDPSSAPTNKPFSAPTTTTTEPTTAEPTTAEPTTTTSSTTEEPTSSQPTTAEPTTTVESTTTANATTNTTTTYPTTTSTEPDITTTSNSTSSNTRAAEGTIISIIIMETNDLRSSKRPQNGFLAVLPYYLPIVLIGVVLLCIGVCLCGVILCYLHKKKVTNSFVRIISSNVADPSANVQEGDGSDDMNLPKTTQKAILIPKLQCIERVLSFSDSDDIDDDNMDIIQSVNTLNIDIPQKHDPYDNCMKEFERNLAQRIIKEMDKKEEKKSIELSQKAQSNLHNQISIMAPDYDPYEAMENKPIANNRSKVTKQELNNLLLGNTDGIEFGEMIAINETEEDKKIMDELRSIKDEIMSDHDADEFEFDGTI